MKNPETNTMASAANNDLLDRIDAFLEKNRNIFLGISILITALLCYLLFDARMSFATDDSEYVIMANNFIHKGGYPTYHGTLYPIFLGLLMQVFGFKVPLFKLFSAFLMVAQGGFFYKAFRGKVAYLVLFVVLIYMSVNSYFIYFGSQTYSEALTLCVQSVAFIFFLNHIKLLGTNPTLKQSWKSWLWFGFFMVLLTVTKNILIIGVGSAALYFLIYKEWMNAVLAVLSFAVFKIPYELFTRLVLGAKTTSQLDQIMLKNFYNPAEGNEDFPGGYIERFFENFNGFISAQAYKILGLRPEYAELRPQPKDLEPNVILSLIFAAACVFAFVYLLRRNRYMVFALLFGAGVAFVSFAAVQTIWNVQWRLILPYMPYIMIAIFSAFWYWTKQAKQPVFKSVFAGIMILFILIQLPTTSGKITANNKRLAHHSISDMKAGVEPQYVDFVAICDSIKDKVPATAIIATGKPGEATVYSRFTNFQRIPMPRANESADSVLIDLKKQGVTYLFLDGFSRQVNSAAQIIEKTYPQKLKPVLQSGIASEHPLYLLEIQY